MNDFVKNLIEKERNNVKERFKALIEERIDNWSVQDENGNYKRIISKDASQRKNELESRGVTNRDIVNLCENMYREWYIHTLPILATEVEDEEVRDYFKKFVFSTDYAPSMMTGIDCFNFLLRTKRDDKIGKYMPVISLSSSLNNVKLTQEDLDKTFSDATNIKIQPKVNRFKKYIITLNIKPEDALVVLSKTMNFANEDNLDIDIEWITSKKVQRTDSLSFHCDEDEVESLIQILKGLRMWRPELFEDAEEINPLLCHVDGFIGFGNAEGFYHIDDLLQKIDKELRAGEIVRLSNMIFVKNVSRKMGLKSIINEKVEKAVRDEVKSLSNNIWCHDSRDIAKIKSRWYKELFYEYENKNEASLKYKALIKDLKQDVDKRFETLKLRGDYQVISVHLDLNNYFNVIKDNDNLFYKDIINAGLKHELLTVKTNYQLTPEIFALAKSVDNVKSNISSADIEQWLQSINASLKELSLTKGTKDAKINEDTTNLLKFKNVKEQDNKLKNSFKENVKNKETGKDKIK